MTTTEPNFPAQVESHIAAYLRNHHDPRTNDDTFDQGLLDIKCRRAGSAINGLNVSEAQSARDYELPLILATAQDATPISPGQDCDWWQMPLQVSIFTPISDDVGEDGEQGKRLTAKLHAARSGAVGRLLMNYMEAQAEIPESFPPAVIFGFDQDGIANEQTEKVFATHYTFKASGMPWEPLDEPEEVP